MFEKNLNDLVRGIRNSKSNEAKYINQCLEEIKQELRQENMNLKGNAVAKLIYLEMHGYDISWAAFNVIEVMSSTKLTHKRIGYLAASQCFHEELDVLMLTTNLVKKDMCAQNQYDAGVAMNGLSVFITADLARDLANDVMNLMVSSRSYIRKKSVLLMYKVFLNFPEALRPAFPRLKEKLEDQDPGVQCSAVNVICELARKNPKNYLSLAPLFFKLMTTSSNNWMLIKIIKLFGALCPLEPRLGKKLLEPLTNLIHSTSAMSLLYECINTVISGLSEHIPSIQLCVSKLRLLVEDPDQNLKYLGLLSLNRILAKVPKAIHPHKDLILQCLDDRDESIRYRALDLVVGMISKKTLMDIVKKLMLHLQRAEGTSYRDELLAKIIQLCSQSNYQYITNFEWYIDCLVQLSSIENTKHGKLIASQMLDVTIRVKAVRSYAVTKLSSLLEKINILSGSSHRDGTCEVLYAAAWLSGEFSEHLDDIKTRLESLLHPRASLLPGHIQGVYVQNSFKLFTRMIVRVEKEGDDEAIKEVGAMLRDKLPMFAQSSNLEVQERACCFLQIINHILKLKESDVKVTDIVIKLFSDELIPVSAKAQKKVPVPEGLNLDKWINEPQSDSSDAEDIEQSDLFTKNNEIYPEEKVRYQQPSSEDVEKAREQRQQMIASNPHYLKMDSAKKDEYQVDDIPVESLDLPVTLHIDKKGKSKKDKNKKRKKGKGKGDESEDDQHRISYDIMPVEGDDLPEDKEDGLIDSDPHKKLNIDLDTPLESHEVLPVRMHRVVTGKQGEAEVEKVEEAVEKKSKRTKKVKKDHSNEKNKKKRTKEKAKEKSEEEKKHPKTKSSSLRKKRSRSHGKDSTSHSEVSSPTPSKATLLAQAAELRKQSNEDQISISNSGVGHEEKKNLDEMDFWLSSSDAPTAVPDAKQGAAVKPSQEISMNNDAISKSNHVNENAAPPKAEKLKEKKKKGKKEKKAKKESKKELEVIRSELSTPDNLLMDSDAVQADPHEQYAVLGADSNLQMLFDIKVSAKDSHRIIASVIFRNLTDGQLISLEFNVIDSLNMKMHRNMGDSPHDPVNVPFQLPPGTANEGQFAFSVESIVMPHWLRGTVTYIVKRHDGSTSEKIDFKLNFPVSAYVVHTSVDKDHFANLLSGGTLTEKQSMTIKIPEDLEFDSVISKLCSTLHTTVVERAELGVSLYGYTIQHHELLFLVKLKGDNTISVDIKTTDAHLVSSILKETKDIFQD